MVRPTGWIPRCARRPLRGALTPFVRLSAEEHDHLGDCSSLRGGLYEMRLAGRIGLRVYFANIDGAIVLLLGG